MNGIKPWQLAIVIVGLIGGIGLVVWNVMGKGEIRRPDSILLMDVITGDRFIADVSGRKSVFIPEKNPETGKYTLVIIHKADDGTWTARGVETVTDIPIEEFKAISGEKPVIAHPSDAKTKPLRRK
jgi:hypothetical protein